jgi:hypothetical protein
MRAAFARRIAEPSALKALPGDLKYMRERKRFRSTEDAVRWGRGVETRTHFKMTIVEKGSQKTIPKSVA